MYANENGEVVNDDEEFPDDPGAGEEEKKDGSERISSTQWEEPAHLSSEEDVERLANMTQEAENLKDFELNDERLDANAQMNHQIGEYLAFDGQPQDSQVS